MPIFVATGYFPGNFTAASGQPEIYRSKDVNIMNCAINLALLFCFVIKKTYSKLIVRLRVAHCSNVVAVVKCLLTYICSSTDFRFLVLLAF